MIDGFSQRAALVTGGAGFVGSNLVRALLAAGASRVRVIDNLLSAERWNVPADDRVEFVEGSVADDRVLERIGDENDYIFHLCVYHGNQSSMRNPLADHEHSQLTTLKLFERVKSFRRLTKLVYAGAGCAVAKKTSGEPDATAEDAPITLEMDSPYSISKLVGEFYAVYYARQHRAPFVRVRFQNVYGPGEILGAGQWRGTPATVWRNVTPTFIYKALVGERLPLEGGGDATRDFVFVEDIVRGLMLAAVRGACGDVYNLASGAETSIRELALAINRLAANTAPVEVLPGRAWDRSGRRYGDPAKARDALGFTTQVPLERGLEQTVAWTRANLPAIARCIERHAAAMAEYERTYQHAAH